MNTSRIRRPALLLLAAGTMLMSTPVAVGEQQSSEKIVYEAYAETVPLDPDTVAPPAIVPSSSQFADAFQEGINIYELSAVTPERITEADLSARQRFGNIHPGPRRVGIVRKIEPVPLSGESSLPTKLENGKSVWTQAIRSPGALGIRLHFANFDVGTGSLLVYARTTGGLVTLDPFSEQGPQRKRDFWTASLPGDTVFIEVMGANEPRFEIAEIVHFDRDPTGFQEDRTEDNEAVLNCHLDVMCYGEPPVDATARKATGKMNFASGGESYVCTGTLLSDHDSETRVPHFLTAAHCVSTQAEVDTLMVTWLWQKDSCNGTLPDPATLPTNVGGTLLTTTDENDMTFIRLAGDLPPGTGLAGWTTETGLDEAVGIHHPGGSWKRVVFLSGVGACPGCLCKDPTDFDYYDMDDGLVEGGASGSGVFNYSGQLAGQLYGRCSDTSDPDDMTCSNIDSYWAVYGEFEETHPLISYWLNIGGTMHVDRNNTTPPWIGSPAHPFFTVSQANNAAWDSLRIKIHAGDYPETLRIDKNLTLIASGGTVRIGQ